MTGLIEPSQVINLFPKASNEGSGTNGGDDQQFSEPGQGGTDDYWPIRTAHVQGDWSAVEHTAVDKTEHSGSYWLGLVNDVAQELRSWLSEKKQRAYYCAGRFWA